MKGQSVIGIIGGSGVYKLDGMKVHEYQEVTTPFGRPSAKIGLGELNGVKFYFMPRHGESHTISPSEINYQANIYAMKSLGVSYLLSISAVGSLKEELAPGDFFLPTQLIDWTKGLRPRTFFSEGMVGHVSVAEPIDKNLLEVLKASCEKAGIEATAGGSYICIEGPQFSSKAETAIYRSFGASVIGMTNVPESYLAKEAGLSYATVAMVTDYDCWKDEHCTLEEIMAVMKSNYLKAQKLIENFLPTLMETKPTVDKQNTNAVVTSPDHLTDAQKKILEVVLK